jgi:hypothetical protein
MLLGLGLARAEASHSRWLTWLQGGLAFVGLLMAACLGTLIWLSMEIHTRDVASLIQYHSEDTYRLSMAHILDLTPQTFAIFRGPAIMAGIVFLVGFSIAWILRRKQKPLASTLTVAFAMLVFYFAANWAFQRFSPRMASRDLANTIIPYLRAQDQIVQYGDFNYGSSIAYYTFRHDLIWNGCTGTNLEYGSKYPDIPLTFIDDQQFSSLWHGPNRIFLFVPEELRQQALSRLQPNSAYLLAENGGKYIFVNQPVRAGLPLLATILSQQKLGQ